MHVTYSSMVSCLIFIKIMYFTSMHVVKMKTNLNILEIYSLFNQI